MNYAHGFGGMNADTPVHPSCQPKKEPMKKQKGKHSPLPWRHEADRKRKMSAVVDATGIVVCGSLICQQADPRHHHDHALIVEAVSKSGQNQDAPKQHPPGQFVVFVDNLDGDVYTDYVAMTHGVDVAFQNHAKSVLIRRWKTAR